MALDKKLRDFNNTLSRLEESIDKTNAYQAQEEYSFLESHDTLYKNYLN